MDELEIQVRDGERLDHLRDWVSKLAGQVARIAGLLHLATHVDSIQPPRSDEMSERSTASLVRFPKTT